MSLVSLVTQELLLQITSDLTIWVQRVLLAAWALMRLSFRSILILEGLTIA